MRAGSSIYVNYLQDDLLPLSDAPNPEKPFKDPNFTVELFKSIGAYGRYWRSKGKVVSFEGIKDESTGTLGKTWASDIDSALEFHPVDWEKIAQYLTEWKEKKCSELRS